MKFAACLPLLCVASCLLVGCGERTASPSAPPGEVAARWWRAVASGDGEAVAGSVASDSGRAESAKMVAEYARVRKAAGEGDRLAGRMLTRLEGVRIGESRGSTMLAVVPLTFADGKPFLKVYLESRGGRWLIVDLK